MAGGLLQLIYIGTQDIYLTKDPEITFFKYIYKRHTNFSLDTSIENFQSMPGFGKISRFTVPKKGDLLKNITLNIKLPSLNSSNISTINCICGCCSICQLNNNTPSLTYSWANGIGHIIIDYVELQIGGKVIDKHTGEFLDIWTELTQPEEKRYGYNEMIGKKDPACFSVNSFPNSMDLYVPLSFSFCRNIGLALPLISLYNDDIEIFIKFKQFKECWVSNIQNSPAPLNSQLDVTILADYIYLDLDERRKFSQSSHLLLTEQLQYTSQSFNSNCGNPRIDLYFNHPIKQLIWIVQREDVIGPANGLYTENSIVYPAGNDWLNFSSSLIPWLSDGKESFDKGSIYFDGIERVQEFSAKYFRLYLPYQYQTRIPHNYIYTYNFGLKTEELQPSGTCNWSRIEHSHLSLKIKKIDYPYKIRVYAINYNWLLITNGMGSLLYLN